MPISSKEIRSIDSSTLISKHSLLVGLILHSCIEIKLNKSTPDKNKIILLFWLFLNKYKVKKRMVPEIAKILNKSLLESPRERAIIKIDKKLKFFLPNRSIKDKGKIYDTNKTGSLNVPIALWGSYGQNMDCAALPNKFVLDLFRIGSYKSNICDI